MITWQFTITGIWQGSILALAALGVVLTYKATGVFNFAHGAIAMFVGYVMWQTSAQWHWPLLLATLFSVVIAGPGIGVLLELAIFRPLGRKGASTSQKLIATLGVFILFTGLVLKLWTGKARTVPRIITNRGIHLPNHVIVGVDQLVTIAIVLGVAIALAVMLRRTPLGLAIRAVVDRRQLAELTSINANLVAAVGWALGCGMAGLAGVLYAQGVGGGLDPFHLTLFVTESFSVAVVASLSSLVGVVLAGTLLLGAFVAYLKAFTPKTFPLTNWHLPLWFRNDVDLLKPTFSVVVLFIALVVLRHLDEPADAGQSQRGLVGSSLGRRLQGRSVLLMVLPIAAAITLLPFGLNDINIRYGQEFLAITIIFVSIVAITGFAGYITLGQAGFAGFGAYFACRMVLSLHMPVVLAVVVGGLGAMAVGIVTGYPALNRRGLFLGLTTLAMGLVAYEVVFQNVLVFKSRGLVLARPSLFGWSLDGQKAFYFFELACLALLLLLAHNLRSGRMGRILAAMRDSEVATQSIGIELRRYKLFIFAVSAFIAGIGGALLTQQGFAFSADNYQPVNSLLWFTVVIVAGVDSLLGAVLAGAIYVLLDIVFGTSGGSQLVIAPLALFIGYLPGGSLVGLGRRLVQFVRRPRSLERLFAEAIAERRRPRPAGGPADVRVEEGAEDGLVPTPFARELLEASRR
jgi:branched-chain amino acid transport system permease protein